MEAIRMHQVVRKDGEIKVTGLPCQRGQDVEMILLFGEAGAHQHMAVRASDLRGSRIVGLWKDRDDIVDASRYARRLRKQSQRRRVAS